MTMYMYMYLYIQVYFMRPHPQQSEIVQWAAEWSRYCAVLFYHTTQAGDSDIRVDFNEGERGRGWVTFEPLTGLYNTWLTFV